MQDIERRRKYLLEDIFISKVRVKVLQLFYGNLGQIFHVREIVRRVSEEINAVRRELARLEKAGMVTSEWRANRRYYYIRTDYVFGQDLLSMVAKTTGLGGDIVKGKSKLGKVKFAMLSGVFARNIDAGPNEVDLLLVGNIIMPQISSFVKDEEARRGREINYTVMTEEEFTFRKRRRDPFLLGILEKPKIMLVGDEAEMLK